jgi:hypothetical protein
MSDKDFNTGFSDLQKLNHIGQGLKSKDYLMSYECQNVVATINSVSYF